MIEKDIRQVDPEEIRRRYLQRRDLDLLVVCAPCQPFSAQNQKRGRDDRTELVLESARFAQALRPKLIFIENVPGLATRGELLARLKKALGADYILGFPHRVDAADYGVPQRRVRCIMLAARKQEPPTLPDPASLGITKVDVRGAIGHLRKLKSGQRDKHDVLHVARSHQAVALKRLALIPKDGGSRSSLPRRLQLSCHIGTRRNSFPDVYGRMSWNSVAPTLTTGCTDVTRGRFAHPRDDRAITLREAALLQTFPPHYRFKGNASQIQMQIGNAVPVKLVDALARTFRSAISS